MPTERELDQQLQRLRFLETQTQARLASARFWTEKFGVFASVAATVEKYSNPVRLVGRAVTHATKVLPQELEKKAQDYLKAQVEKIAAKVDPANILLNPLARGSAIVGYFGNGMKFANEMDARALVKAQADVRSRLQAVRDARSAMWRERAGLDPATGRPYRVGDIDYVVRATAPAARAAAAGPAQLAAQLPSPSFDALPATFDFAALGPVSDAASYIPPPPLQARQLSPDLMAALAAGPGRVEQTSLPASAGAVPQTSLGGVMKGNLRSGLSTAAPGIATALATGDFKGAATMAVNSVGSAIGGAVGGMFGPIGAQIGAALGGLVSKIGGLFKKPEWKNVMKDVGRDWGVTLSEETSKAIAEDSKKFGDRRTAEVFNLDKILGEAGGLSDKNLGTFTAKLRDVFVHYERGALSAAQATQVLDKNFKAFADFVTQSDSLAPANFLEIIKLQERTGIRSGAVDEFVRGQTGRAIGGLDTFLNTGAPIAAGSEGAFAGVVAGAFGALTQHGLSALDAFKQLDPVLTALEERFGSVGFHGSAAFESLRSMALVVHDEVAGPAIMAVSALNDVLLGVHNSGYMNQEMFSGLASQVTATFESLVAQGQNADVLMQLMAPTLQTLWEMQQNFGFSVDESTQALLNQAIEAGKVGEAHMSAQEMATKAMQDAATAMAGVAEVLSAAFAQAGANGQGVVNQLTDAVGTIPREIDITVRGHYVPPDIPAGGGGSVDVGGMYVPTGHDGGLVVPGGLRPDEVPAILQTGERVLNRRETAAYHAGMAAAGGAAGGAGADDRVVSRLEEINTSLANMPRATARAVRDALLLAGAR